MLNEVSVMVCRYFRPIQRRADVLLPFTTTSTLGQFDVHARIHGGGMTGGPRISAHISVSKQDRFALLIVLHSTIQPGVSLSSRDRRAILHSMFLSQSCGHIRQNLILISGVAVAMM